MTEQAQGQPTTEDNGTQGQGQEQERTFTQADLNKIAANEKREGRTARESELLQQTGAESIDDILSAYTEYQGIQEAVETEADRANTRAERLDKRIKEELQPKAEKADRYEAALNSLLEKEREGLPEHITSLLDGRDPDQQLSWIAENREAIAEAQKPATVGRGSAPGSGSRSTLYGIDKVRAASGL